MSEPYVQPADRHDGDFAGRNWRQVRAIRDEACRTGGEDDFVLMTLAQALDLIDGYQGPDGDAVAEVEEVTEEPMWCYLGQFLNDDIDPDDEQYENAVYDALHGPVLDAMVVTIVRGELSPASYDALIRSWRLHCEREGIELP